MAFNFGSSFGSNTGSGFGFGTTSTAPTTGGFGTTSAPAASTGFGFGTTPATTSSFGTSLFGSSTSAPSTGLFGSTTSSTTSNPFGLTTAGFGAPAATAGFGSLPTTSAPATSTFVTSSTPFTELPQNYRDLMINMETLIRTTSNARDEIREHNKTVRGKREIDITAVMEKLSTLSLAIERDTHSLTSFREDVRKELSSAEIATRHLSRLQPRTNMTGTTTTSNVSLHENIYLPSPYHWNKLDEFHQRMSKLATSIREIDEYMSSMEHQTYNEPQSLPNVLRSQYDVLMILTARLATLHQSVEELRQRYREIYGDDVATRMFRRIPMHTLEIPMGNAQQQLFGGSGSLAGIGMTPGATTGTSNGYTLPPATNPAAGLTGNTSSTIGGGFNFGTTTPAAGTSTSSLFGTTTPATTTTTAGNTGGGLFGGGGGFGTTSFDTTSSFATPTTFSRTQSTSAMNKARGRSTGGRR